MLSVLQGQRWLQQKKKRSHLSKITFSLGARQILPWAMYIFYSGIVKSPEKQWTVLLLFTIPQCLKTKAILVWKNSTDVCEAAGISSLCRWLVPLLQMIWWHPIKDRKKVSFVISTFLKVSTYILNEVTAAAELCFVLSYQNCVPRGGRWTSVKLRECPHEAAGERGLTVNKSHQFLLQDHTVLPNGHPEVVLAISPWNSRWQKWWRKKMELAGSTAFPGDGACFLWPPGTQDQTWSVTGYVRFN